MLTPPLSSQIAGSATPSMAFPFSQGWLSSISRILLKHSSGVHFTPVLGSLVQP